MIKSRIHYTSGTASILYHKTFVTSWQGLDSSSMDNEGIHHIDINLKNLVQSAIIMNNALAMATFLSLPLLDFRS